MVRWFSATGFGLKGGPTVDNDVAVVTGVRTFPAARLSRGPFFVACLVAESAVFAILPLSSRLPVGPLLQMHAGVTAVFLVAAVLSRRSQAGRQYWPVLYALFVAGTAVLLSTLFGDRLLELLPLPAASPSWIAVAKLSESLWRLVPILLLMAIAGADLRSLYLTRGRLGLGLGVGVAGFLVLAGMSFVPVFGQDGGWEKLLAVWPWILMFVLANGFTEELLFRGLFLRRYEPFLGKGLSNLLAALAFTLLHMQVTYVSDLATFLLILFPLALAWGWLMQKSDSLWGSALFHAGADCLIVFGIFAAA
jgi:membrane protease YdiL (CAAX protease family)